MGLGRFELPSRAPEARSLDQASPQPPDGFGLILSIIFKFLGKIKTLMEN